MTAFVPPEFADRLDKLGVLTTPAFAGLRDEQPELFETLEAKLRAYLMETWEQGVVDGLEMAVRMATGLRGLDNASEQQRDVLRVLIDGFEQAKQRTT